MLTYPILYYAQRRTLGEVRDENLFRLQQGLPAKAGHWFVLPERKQAPHEHDALLAVLRRNYAEDVRRLPDGSALHVFDLSRRTAR
jgi:hypothetical protein